MLNDNFVLLNEPRHPWLDIEAVQARFIALSGELHPDRVHLASPGEKAEATLRFAALNAAWNCLRNPKERLAHLVELESGAKPHSLERLPSAAADFYFRLGQVCREVDSFLGEKASASSPLVKARLFEQALAWTDTLQARLAQLQEKHAQLEAEAKALNPIWDAAPPVGSEERRQALPLDRLEQLYREFSYCTRWADQVRERIVQLSF